MRGISSTDLLYSYEAGDHATVLNYLSNISPQEVSELKLFSQDIPVHQFIHVYSGQRVDSRYKKYIQQM